MDITVMLEPLDSRGYRATGALPTPLVAEGNTREEALSRLSKLVQEQLVHAEFVQLTVPLPLKQVSRKSLAGIWKNHPDIDEVVENIREYRRQVDADPNRP